MPIQVIWGNDLNAYNKFLQQLIDTKVSKAWKEINVTHLNGDDEAQIYRAMEEILTPPLGDGSRVVILKNNPMFSNTCFHLVKSVHQTFIYLTIKILLFLSNIKTYKKG